MSFKKLTSLKTCVGHIGHVDYLTIAKDLHY